jgi:hypothetical protein
MTAAKQKGETGVEQRDESNPDTPCNAMKDRYFPLAAIRSVR